MLDVPDVERDAVLPGQARSPVDLRPAGDTGPHLETPPLARRVALHLIGERGAGTDEAHVTPHDVPELRQLVERQPPQHPSRTRDARIALVDREAGALPLRTDVHRAELHELELFAVQPDAPLAIENGTAVVELDRQRRRGQEGARHRQAETGGGCVERTIHRVPSALAHTAGTPKRRYRKSDTTVAQVTST